MKTGLRFLKLALGPCTRSRSKFNKATCYPLFILPSFFLKMSLENPFRHVWRHFSVRLEKINILFFFWMLVVYLLLLNGHFVECFKCFFFKKGNAFSPPPPGKSLRKACLVFKIVQVLRHGNECG